MGKKVFSVYLGAPDNSNHAELDLPATPWELIDALDKLRLVDGREPYWQVEDIGRYGFLAPLLDDSNLYQFNALAEQLSTFGHVEAIAFEGLVQMEVDKLCQTNGGELTLQRLLDLAYSVDRCHVVPGIRDDAALGRFYVENDFLPELEQVPESVLELLDYAKIGERMRREEHGAMTPNGYVVREAELRQAPPNLGRPPRKPPYMIYFLCVSDVRTVKLYLPAKQAELDAVLDCLEVDSFFWLHEDGFYPQTQLAAAASAVQPELVRENTISVTNLRASARYLYAPYELLPGSAGLDAASIGDRTLLGSGLRGQRTYGFSAAQGLITQYQRINTALSQTTEQQTPFLQDEAAYNAFVYDRYTAIPSDIRSYLADKLGDYAVSDGEAHFDYQSAKQNILFYLTTYAEYDETNVTPVGSGVDFVLNFLDGTRKGYSVHYATAAAMMFRYYGIPARYVEGFLVSKQETQTLEPGQTLALDGSHIHTWVEYYQDGVGWLPFEVTPPYFSAVEQTEKYQDISGLIGQQPQDTVVDNIQDNPQGDDTNEPSLLNFWLKYRLQILLILAVTAALALLAAFIAWLMWERKKTARRKASFLSEDLPASIQAIFAYTIDVLRARGLRAKNCAPEDYADLLDPDLRASYRQAAAIWQEARFSGHPMEEAQRQTVLALESELWRRTWEQANILRRIKLKYILFL